jgi:endonuclease/exonuclease/phosphatase family metal-dependent hydrolase
MPTRFRLIAVALAAAALLVPAVPAQAQSKEKPELTVMSRNLYLGADLIPLAAAPDRAAFEQAATQRWQIVQATNFPVRAKALAAEVRREKPDVIGIQEAAIWRRGPDGVKDGSATPATTVVYDLLKTFQKELKARGQRYRVVKTQNEFDFEAPTSLGYDIRLTQQDAILVRSGVRARNAKSRNYKDALTIPTQVGPAKILRGWVSADVTVDGERFRFVNTHLEAYSGGISGSQAKELLSRTGPTRTKLPVVLTGDLNSAPNDPAPGRDAYRAVTGGGFTDIMKRLKKTANTCCQDERLDNPQSKLTRRIDFIMTKGKFRALSGDVLGESPSDRVSGLWPSDHAGVVATLRFP